MTQLNFFRKDAPSEAGPKPSMNTARTPGMARTPGRRRRFMYVLGFFCFWASAICFRLVWLQVVRHHEFLDRAARQQQRTFEVAPRRGMLYDRDLHELAMTVLVDSIYAVPTEISNKAATAEALARVVHTDPTDSFTSSPRILARMTASKDFAWVARKQDAALIQRVKALNLKGVYFQREFKRFYPNNDIAAQVLGYVGTDDNGLGGLEQRFDDELHGTPGHMLTALDAKRHVLGSQESEPLPGENLVLTLDENIQFMAERALDHAMEKFKALNGTIVVQDPHTGQILALAIRPTFDPNDFRHATTELLRNKAISDVYEPGSTFKLVTYSAALEEKIAKPTDMIDCQGGKMVLFGRTIHDAELGMGRITVEEALWHSSDVAAVKLALRMGPDRFYRYMRAYGFGDRSGIELPSETRGLLRQTKRWGATSIGSLAIGQEVGVTPIQLVTMVSSIANGGEYLPPHVLLQSTDAIKGSPQLQATPFHPNQQLPSPLPDGSHRVISTMTAAQMRKMMEGIVLFGSGRPAALNGYSAGGKTGTAQKIDVRTRTYSKTKFVASFAGFAPVNNPVVSVAVIIDSPVGEHFGAKVSAPVFAEVAQQVLEYLGVPHDTDLKTPAPSEQEPLVREEPSEHTGDINALFADVNDLPADDPLRTPPSSQLVATALNSAGEIVSGTPAGSTSSSGALTSIANTGPPPSGGTSTDTIAPTPERSGDGSTPGNPAGRSTTTPTSRFSVSGQRAPGQSAFGSSANGTSAAVVVLDARHRVAVPSFIGDSVRKAIEQAGLAGLSVQVIGTGTGAEQAPAPGTVVPTGTEVVVRFRR